MPRFDFKPIVLGPREPLPTPEAQRALAQLTAIKRDPAHPVNDPTHPGYDAAWEAMRSLYLAAYGDQAQ